MPATGDTERRPENRKQEMGGKKKKIGQDREENTTTEQTFQEGWRHSQEKDGKKGKIKPTDETDLLQRGGTYPVFSVSINE